MSLGWIYADGAYLGIVKTSHCKNGVSAAIHLGIIVKNYSPKWSWTVVDIYRAAKRQGKYPPLFTDTEVNNCFSIYHTSWINSGPKSNFIFDNIPQKFRSVKCSVSPSFTVKCSVSPSCRQIKLLQALVLNCCGVIFSMVEINSSCCWNQAEKHLMFHCIHCDFSAWQFS